MRVGNYLGNAVKVDDTSRETLRGRFARICFEVDLNKPIIPIVNVLGHNEAVEHEGLHQICFDCG